MYPPNINYEFSEFGRRMYILGICALLTFIPILNIVAAFIMLIVIILALGNINRIQLQIGDQNLRQFRHYIIISFVFAIISAVALIIGTVLGVMFLIVAGGSIILTVIIVLIAVTAIAVIAGILEFLAWRYLDFYFNLNGGHFPQQIARECHEGTGYLKLAAMIGIISSITSLFIMMLVGILVSLLAAIFEIVGYFKLGKLKYLYQPPAPMYQPAMYPHPYYPGPPAYPMPPQPKTIQPVQVVQGPQDKVANVVIPTKTIQKEQVKFCMYCGASLPPNAKFCEICGQSVISK